METKLVKVEAENRGLDLFNPEALKTIQIACRMFAYSELVPDMYRVSETNSEAKAIANCMIALDISNRIGASPLMVMQNLVIVHGRPTWSSKFLIATVNTCGRFTPLQFEFTNLGKLGKVEYTFYEKKWMQGQNGGKGYYKNEAKTEIFDGTAIDNIQCICYGFKKGTEEKLQSIPVTIEMAIKEGWHTKAGSKWKTMPQQMLTYRSASFWTNTYAPELSMGMRTDDEVLDIEHEVVETKINETQPAKPEANEPKEISLKDLKGQKETKEETKEEAKPEPQQPEPSEPKEQKSESNEQIKRGF